MIIKKIEIIKNDDQQSFIRSSIFGGELGISIGNKDDSNIIFLSKEEVDNLCDSLIYFNQSNNNSNK